MRSPLLLSVLLAAACGGGPQSPFVRVTSDSGRVYYADMDKALHSEHGGFLTFRDLVTGEQVRLKNGSYSSGIVPREEVKVRQVEYLRDPRRVPHASDYE